MKKKALIAILVIVVIGAGFWLWQGSSSDGETFLTEKAVVGDIVQRVQASGEVGALQFVSVGAQVSGQIKKLHVTLGQTVKKGDLLAEIDSVSQLNQLNIDKAKLESYTAQLESKKVALRNAQLKYNRELKLRKKDATSEESYEEALTALEAAKAEIIELESLIRQTNIALSTDELNLSYTRITSPLDGTVVSVPVDEGQTVNANQTTPTIVQIADLNTMEISIEISEGDICSVKPGQVVEYSILSLPDTVFKTTLTSIDPGLTTLTDGQYESGSSSGSSSSGSSSSSSAAVYFYGKAVVDNSNGPLRIGMTTQNEITVAEARDAVLVPIMAVTSGRKGKSVLVLNEEGKPERRAVETGITDGVNIQITSGLKPGEAVIMGRLSPEEIKAQSQMRRRGPRM